MTESIWSSMAENQGVYPELAKDIDVDVVIIGAGITGLTAAWQIAKSGKTVVVLEANTVGSGTTGNSTGNLYVAVQPYYQNIFSKFDEQTAREIASARQYAIDFIEKISQQENISCGFTRRPWYLYTNDPHQSETLKREVECFQQINCPINYTNELPLGFKFKHAAVLENQARFNPLQYVLGMAEKLNQKGVQIYENTRVVYHKESNGIHLTTHKKFKVKAKFGIIATHTPIGINPIHLYTAPYRSYVVGGYLPNQIYPEGHFWDLDHPHHVTCTHSRSGGPADILLISGNHHKTGQNQDNRDYFKELEHFLRDNLSITEFVHHWSAQHYHSADDVPYIGLTPGAKQTVMATGFFADGLVYGTLSGIICSQMVAGDQQEPWQQTFNSKRSKPLASAKFLIRENLNVFLQYLKDLPLLVSPKDFADLKPGEGKVVEIDQDKWAVSKDEHHQLKIVSAVCTHMKCIVKWNTMEKTWDCPCHGSRFTCDGKVIEGPASSNLEKKSGV